MHRVAAEPRVSMWWDMLLRWQARPAEPQRGGDLRADAGLPPEAAAPRLPLSLPVLAWIR